MKVIILGDRQTLTRHPFYKQLWNYITQLKDTDYEEKPIDSTDDGINNGADDGSAV